MENGVIYLSAEQRSELERCIKDRRNGIRMITRAAVVLKLDRSNKKDHLRMSRIIEETGVSRQGVYNIRNAFLEAESVRAFLTRKKRERPPVEPKITGEIEAQIIALACSKPPDGYAKWTLRLLADKSVELGYVDSLSHMSVKRLLKKHNLSLI